MSIFELRNPTSIDPALGINAVSAALKENAKENGGNRAQAGASAQDPPRRAEMTTGNVSTYLQAISATSCGEIDALISDLHQLRERLMTEGGRIEQGIAEFATLNQSVMKLTEVISDSVAHLQAPGVAG